MELHQSDAELVPTQPEATEAAVPSSRPRQRAWRGAKTGFRLVSYVAGPLAFLFILPALALLAIGVGSGRGWDVPRMLFRAVGFFVGCTLLGAFVGAMIGLSRVDWPTTRVGRWLAAANHPIRLFPRRRSATDSPTGDPGPPRTRRHRRIWPWLVGVPVLLVLAAGLGAGRYWGRMIDRRLDAAITAADSDDPSWRIDDLMADREVVPDEENSALIVAEVLSFLPKNWPKAPTPPPGELAPPRTEIEIALERLNLTADNVRLDDATADTLRAEMEKYREAVELARTVADYRRGRHELEIGPTVFDTLLPETQAARTAARLLAIDAAVLAHDGDLDGALDSCRAILGIGRSIGDEPFLMSQLVRIAIGNVATSSARRVMAQGEPSEAALARLQCLLLDEMVQPLLYLGMRGERAMLVEFIRRIAAEQIWFTKPSDSSPPPLPVGLRASIGSWGRLLYENQMAIALEWMNRAVAISRLTAAVRKPAWEALDSDIRRLSRIWHTPYTGWAPARLMPATQIAEESHDRYHGGLGATALLVAAERHRRMVGEWPGSIDVIDRDIIPSPPVDPITGRAYRMERREEGLAIYSIGPDRKDDHGAFDIERWKRGGPFDVGGEVWNPPRRARPARGDE